MNEVIWTTFDAGQDNADAEIVSSDGTSVTLDGNSWRGFELPTTVTVTTDTVLSFHFQSTDLCEIHGIALGPVGSDPSDDGSHESWTNVYLCGSQDVCSSAHWECIASDQTCDETGTSFAYSIPLSDYWEVGTTYSYFGIINDCDANSGGHSTYSYITIDGKLTRGIMSERTEPHA